MKKIVDIKILEDRSPHILKEKGFLEYQRLKLVNIYDDNSSSKPYMCDIVHRPGIDCVTIIVYYIDKTTRKIYVGLRKGIRPSAFFRKQKELPLNDKKNYLYVKEAFAGSLEKGDKGSVGISKRALHELFEEAGFEVSQDDIFELGAEFFPSIGQSSEKMYMRAVEVVPSKRKEAAGDGSGMEEGSAVEFYEITEAIRMCQSGDIEDAKAELGFRRLCAKLGYIPELGLWKEELPQELAKKYNSLFL